MDADHEDIRPAIDYFSKHKLQRHAFAVKNNFLCGECEVLFGCLADLVIFGCLFCGEGRAHTTIMLHGFRSDD